MYNGHTAVRLRIWCELIHPVYWQYFMHVCVRVCVHANGCCIAVVHRIFKFCTHMLMLRGTHTQTCCASDCNRAKNRRSMRQMQYLFGFPLMVYDVLSDTRCNELHAIHDDDDDDAERSGRQSRRRAHFGHASARALYK